MPESEANHLAISLKEEIINHPDYNQQIIAEKMGKNRSYLSQKLNGTVPMAREDAKLILTQGMGFSNEEAEDKIAKWMISYNEQYLKRPHGGISKEDPISGYVKIPLLGDISCGNPMELQHMYDPSIEPESEELIRAEFIPNPEKTVAFLANGNSMEPDISRGSLILVEHSNAYQGPHMIHAFRFGNDYGLGRIVRGKDVYMIDKANKDWPKIPIDTDEFEICGFVQAIIYNAAE